jgi:hypothetical protein
MFEPQPVAGADIYMLKWILHDWPDAESVAILRALVPALKPGARVVFIDYVGKQEGKTVDERGEPSEGGEAEQAQGEGAGGAADKEDGGEIEIPRSMQAFGTASDLRMMALFNAKERPVAAWKEIFRAADERFEVVRVKADPLTFMCVLEAVWRG